MPAWVFEVVLIFISLAGAGANDSCPSHGGSLLQVKKLVEKSTAADAALEQITTAAKASQAATHIEYSQKGTNECPNGYSKIMHQSQCEAAASMIGGNLGFGGASTWVNLPGGCFHWEYVYFNTHQGAAHGSTDLLCQKQEPCPAPGVQFEYAVKMTNECPSGFIKITEQSQCEAAAKCLGGNLGFGGKSFWESLPGGCFRWDYVYLNTKQGRAHYHADLLCQKQASVPAPPPPPPKGPSGLYLYSPRAANQCPDGSLKITQQSECEAAAKDLGGNLGFGGAFSADNLPGGCLRWDYVYFNTHQGIPQANSDLLCKKT